MCSFSLVSVNSVLRVLILYFLLDDILPLEFASENKSLPLNRAQNQPVSLDTEVVINGVTITLFCVFVYVWTLSLDDNFEGGTPMTEIVPKKCYFFSFISKFSMSLLSKTLKL